MYRTFIFVLALVTRVVTATSGCPLTSVTGAGFNVDFYHYPLINTTQVDPKYNVTTYAEYGSLASTSGVTAVNYSGGGPTIDTPYYGTIYGQDISTSNFSMKLTGYFLASQSGTYQFTFLGDDSIGLSFGSSGTCCGSVTNVVDASSFTVASGETQTISVTLTAGEYYPVQLLYLNVRGWAVVEVGYTAPDGTAVSNLGSEVYQIAQDPECYTTTTAYWTGSDTETTTVSGSNTQTVIVELPYSTGTSYWTESYTSTVTVSPTDGSAPSVIIEVPPSTSTVYWTNAYTSSTTVTPSDGGKPTVIVEVPETTSTTFWTNNYTSTTTLVPSDGGQPTVLVELPPATVTSTWTQSYTTTTTFFPSDGSKPTVYVDVPYQATVQGCPATSVEGSGFNVDFYHYPLISDYGAASAASIDTYKDYGFLGSVAGVTSQDIYARSYPPTEVHLGQIYGFTLTTTNFSMGLTGYFSPPQTGSYTFTYSADDKARISLGSLGDCCGSVSDIVKVSAVSLYSAASFTVILLQGVYYPIQVQYLNVQGLGTFNASFTQPDGTVVKDIGSYVYQIAQASQCYTTTTSAWTGSYTSTTTVSGLGTDKVIVEVPYSTSTSFWTNSYTSTSTITPSDGSPPTVVIDYPPTTSTTYWLESYTTTTTVFPSSGGQPTVLVELPPTTITTQWTESYTTTSTSVPTDGGQPTVYVEVPSPLTSTSTWTGSYTTLTTITGTDGKTTPVVEIPPETTSTSTWTGSYTTLTTITGTDGKTTPVAEIPLSIMSSSSQLPFNLGGWNLTYIPKSSSSMPSPGASQVSPTSIETTETRTIVTTTTDGNGATRILTATVTTTYCPASTVSSVPKVVTIISTIPSGKNGAGVSTVTYTLTYLPGSANTGSSSTLGQATGNGLAGGSGSGSGSNGQAPQSSVSWISGNGKGSSTTSSGSGAPGAGSTSVASTPPAAVSTYEGGSPAMAVILSVAFLPVLALFI